MNIKLIITVSLVAISQPVQASGLATHLWVADQVINDLQGDCEVTIAGVSVDVPAETCGSIRGNPDAFRAGMMGPDTFPDLITGQVTAHPGIENDWQTSDWLKNLLNAASSGKELAFSRGYSTHAAVDMFAHSYVNGYSGDIFELGDERRVELRHFTLEKYIDFRLPSEPRFKSTPPVEFVVDNLLYNKDASRLAGKAGTAPHIVAMNEVRTGVGELNKSLENIDSLAAGTLAEVIAAHLKFGEELATGEAQLQIAGETLRISEQALELEKKLLDELYGPLQNAISEAEKAENKLNIAAREVDRIQGGIASGKNRIKDLNNAIAKAENDAIDLADRILSMPDRIRERVCDWLGPICDWTWDWIDNPAKKELQKQAKKLAQKISDWKRDVANTQTDIAALAASEAAAINAKLSAEAIAIRYRGFRASAQAAYDVQNLRYEAQLKATRETRTVLQNIKDEIARLKSRIIDTAAIRDKIKAFIEDLRPVSALTANWVKGIEVAGREYVETSNEIALKVVKLEDGATSELLEWLTCYGGAFTPVPYQFGEFGCNVVAEYERVQKKVDELVLDALPPPFDRLYEELLTFKSLIKNQVKSETEKAALELVKLGAPDGTTRQMIDLIADPSGATQSKLNDVFASTADSGGKQLISFDRVSDLIDTDLQLTNGKINALKFRALRHSVTMSKLALLDQRGLQYLFWRLGSNAALPPSAHGAGRYSILLDTVRSIDGNHQWQPFGLPYPRAGNALPEPANAYERNYGYGPRSGGGFPIYTNETLRREVFPLIFPVGLGGELMKRPELNGAYPFPECAANPFPIAFNADGTPRSEDKVCSAAGEQTPQSRQKWRRFWRSIAAIFGVKPPTARGVK